MKTHQSKRNQAPDKLAEYYHRLEVLIRECLENDEPRLAWEIIKAEGRHTHSSRRCAEKAGLACIRGLGVALDGVGFVARQNRERTGWRIRFTMALQHWLP